MSLILTLTGTGGAQGVPAWGCECAACARARRSPQYRRQPCSGVVKFNDAITLIDAGLHDLADRWSPGSFQQFLLTHYHMDHVQGLFPLRWGVGDPIPVYGPPDEQGCDDLFKHPGLLDFSHTVEPFVVFDLQGLQVTPLPLNHSKLTFGYLLETAHSRVAWLSDTAGLPEKTLKFLRNNQPQVMVMDCSHPPRADAPRNHCDLNTVLALNQVIRSPRVILTHISHQFDAWLMENALPSGFDPGLLDFSHTVEPFVVFDLQGLQVTPLPLNHSKLTFGYLLETAHSRVAWLSDTAGLPEKTLKFLRNNQPQVMVMDCSHPPRADAPRNHCDLNTVLALNQVIRSPRVILTHISHQFDAWLMENALPSGFEAGFDGMEIEVE